MRLSSLPFFLLACATSTSLTAQMVVSTGQMVHPGDNSKTSATLLNDGRVLVAGGIQDPAVQLYDPPSGTWRTVGGMSTSRPFASTLLLPDGRVLIGGTSDVMEVFDPVRETFSPAGVAPGLVPQVVLSDGRVLLIARFSDPATALFNPATDEVVSVSAIEPGVPIALPDGRLAVVGESAVVVYQVLPSSLQTLVRHDLGSSLTLRSAVLLRDGNVLIAGGSSPPNYDYNLVFLYDPRHDTMTQTGPLPAPEDLFGMVLLGDGRVMTFGAYYAGHPGADDYYEAPAIYDPSSGLFTPLPSVIPSYNATPLLDGRVLLTHAGNYSGGWGGAGPTAMLFLPDPRAVSSADLEGGFAPESLATLFGSELAGETAAASLALPLPESLGGVTLAVRDAASVERPAKLLYVSPPQINFEVPAGTAPGPVTLLLRRDGLQESLQTSVSNVAPRLFVFPDNQPIAYGLRIEPEGGSVVIFPRTPIELGPQPVYLILYATGVRNRSSLDRVTCKIGGTEATVTYAGPDGGGLPGLDQVNVLLPAELQGSGAVDLTLSVDGVKSNTVWIEIE